MEWFKFYGKDWLTDIKIMQLSAEDRLCFITLLCLASSSEIPGTIKNCKEDAIIKLTHLGQEGADRAVGFLERLDDNEMITRDNRGDTTIINYVKRQSKSLTGYERVKRHREKQKEQEKPQIKEKKKIQNDNEMITNDNANDNAREDKIREDKIRIRERGKPQAVSLTLTLQEKENKFTESIRPFFEELIRRGASEDIVRREENKFIVYWTEPNKSKTKLRWETEKFWDTKRRIATWLSRVREFDRNNNAPVGILK